MLIGGSRLAGRARRPYDGGVSFGLTRRQALGLLGTVTLTRLAPVRSALAACDPTPPQTQGPFWLDDNLQRVDIRTDPSDGTTRPGVPLTLKLRVTRSDAACAPAAGVQVDVWQCDAGGVYSDDASTGEPGGRFLAAIRSRTRTAPCSSRRSTPAGTRAAPSHPLPCPRGGRRRLRVAGLLRRRDHRRGAEDERLRRARAARHDERRRCDLRRVDAARAGAGRRRMDRGVRRRPARPRGLHRCVGLPSGARGGVARSRWFHGQGTRNARQLARLFARVTGAIERAEQASGKKQRRLRTKARNGLARIATVAAAAEKAGTLGVPAAPLVQAADALRTAV
jgi:hypothetical protein